MNMLETIKGTILSVPKDISSGIAALRVRDSVSEDPSTGSGEMSPVSPVSPSLHTTFRHHIDHNAGASLLTKFQNGWSEIHKLSEQNAKEAKVVDRRVNDVYVDLQRRQDAVSLFLEELGYLPVLVQSVQAATDSIEKLEVSLEAVESELVKLEDVCERNELQRNMKHHEYQLTAYRQRSNVMLEQAKVKMARDHASKVQQYEHHMQKSLKQKQVLFEESFKAEMQYYKKFGKPIRTGFGKSPSDDADLSQFVPDNDGDLSAFLNTSSGTEDVLAQTDNPQTMDESESEKYVVLEHSSDNETKTETEMGKSHVDRDSLENPETCEQSAETGTEVAADDDSNCDKDE